MAGGSRDGADGGEDGRHSLRGPAAPGDDAGFGSGAPRRDTRGIVDAEGLLSRVRFRRRAAAQPLHPYVEHYWLIDWDLEQPFLSQVVPHPSVNVVFQRYGALPPVAEVAGVGLGLFSISLEGRGQVCGVQFRPGGFRPFLARSGRGTVAALTGRRDPLTEVFPAEGGAPVQVLTPGEEDARVEALDEFLLRLGPEEDAAAERAMRLVHRVRTDRRLTRVGQLARGEGVSVRSLQRLFADCVGVGPKWVILRYRIHEALEQAAGRPDVDWARLAGELGYSDQAHLVRDFTDTVGLPPTEYARAPRCARSPCEPDAAHPSRA
ncbi:helix-turn-helix domain-containing protein [Streptomyces marispadix]|uniref:Helix-turn-helix domain-containing protein n=1 Tax=Streptomyces marispadix TaxID=2922868 RepID=A0ABS9SS37_9ACTN|nr:helix-turn-helix domain-containing protein [Streptomyces marispadix]MCH6159082.1 helix-turn-helix domain-containing protein [Streptomyces marispadix]